MTYREFEIDPHWFEGFVYAHEAYDGSPDANDSRCGVGKTIDECKRKIDQWYLDKSVYTVEHSSSLTPVEFNYMSEAIGFCKFWGIDLTMINHFLRY